MNIARKMVNAFVICASTVFIELLQKEKVSSSLFNEEYKVLFALDKATFTGRLDKYNQEVVTLMEANKGKVSADFIESQKKGVEE